MSNARASLWQSDPDFDSKTAFVFLSVDVVGHSRLVGGAHSNLRMREVHEILTWVRTFVVERIPEYREAFCWDWAGDGGIFGFPASSLEYSTSEHVLDVARRIWSDIAELNEYVRPRNHDQPLHLHIALGRGDAYYVEEAGMRRSDALNVVAKIKGPSRQTAILVTRDIFEDLPLTRRNEFVPMKHGTTAEGVYAYIPATEAALQRLIEDHGLAGEFAEAAHCSYRRAVLDLAVGNRPGALEMFGQCVDLMDRISPAARHRYFWRTMRAFYDAWCKFLEDAPPSLFDRPWEDRRALIANEEAVAFFRAFPSRSLIGNILVHLEFISEQLDIFVERLRNDPTGRTTLEICLTLQRCGYSRRHEGLVIQDRLDRILAEMKKNHSRSVDVDCSFCSGIAASCLLLAGDREHAGELFDWLRTLAWARYCHHPQSYTDAEAHEHALYYASAVLTAFTDCDRSPGRDEGMRSVLNMIFCGERTATVGSEQPFPAHWMRYRSFGEIEVCSYILPALVRAHLGGATFNPEEEAWLGQVVETLASELSREAAYAACTESPGRLYAVRESVGSFALGLLPGIGLSNAAQSMVWHALSLFISRAFHLRSPLIAEEIESDIERARDILNGWLLQWEVILAAGDETVMPEYVKDLRTTFSAGVAQ